MQTNANIPHTYISETFKDLRVYFFWSVVECTFCETCGKVGCDTNLGSMLNQMRATSGDLGCKENEANPHALNVPHALPVQGKNRDFMR